ncbi:MAG: PLP-dependent aspartate aminotransferase family protein [Planctomycetota bacterium]
MTIRSATRLIRDPDAPPRFGGAIVTPIFQSSVFQRLDEEKDGSGYADISYPRMSNLPNHDELARKIAKIEGAEAALVLASGMAAISLSVMDVLQGGGHVLLQKGTYGGTHHLVADVLKPWGVTFDLIDLHAPETWERLVRPETRAICVESISNPLMRIGELEAVVNFAKAHDLVSLIDNTFTTPINFRPVEMGFDVSLHSATKYLAGHSDLVAGAVAASEERIASIHHLNNYIGACLDPHACYLLERGTKTLDVRVERQGVNALRIAKFLRDAQDVTSVHYAGLDDHPDYERGQRLFESCGGMLSFEVSGGAERCERFRKALRIIVNGISLGGVETLLSRPAASSHASLNDEELAEIGLSKTLLRLSVGIESAEDLIADLTQALAASR